MNREIMTSRVAAEANATAILTTAEANSLRAALEIEKNMTIAVKANLSRPTDNAFLMNFIWIRLLEKKISEGVDTYITMDMPDFV